MQRKQALLPLATTNLRYMIKNEWKRKGRFWQPPLHIPKPLIEKGIEIIDPVEVYMKPKYERWQPPVPDDPRFMEHPDICNHPEYHEKPIYEFNMNTRLLKGTTQAQILLKTKVMDESMPQCVRSLIGVGSLPYQDQLVQRHIMQANKWDTTKDKIKRPINRRLPGWKYKAETGIPQKRRANILLKNLFRMMQTSGANHPDLLTSRYLHEDHYASVFYKYNGEHHIQIQGFCNYMMSGNEPLPPFSSPPDVEDTMSSELPDLYPISPTIDLRHQHLWRSENITGFSDGFSHSHPHTFYIFDPEHWGTDQKTARALAFCFGHCVAQAKQRYGWECEELPEPISIQCVHTNGSQFVFVFFQLNTMDFSTNTGVKNLAWIDSHNHLYERVEPMRAMLRNTKYQDYDPEVVHKLLAVFMHGAVEKNISELQHVAAV